MRRSFFVILCPNGVHAPVGERLHLVDRFTGNQSKDMLRGNITPQLFQKDLLIEITP
jgi:hypothetical protein